MINLKKSQAAKVITKFADQAVADGVKSVKKKAGNGGLVILGALTVVFVCVSIWLFNSIISSGISSATNSFKDSKEASHQLAYDKAYNKAYNKAYEKYKVTNSISINVESFKEQSKIQVLKIYEQTVTIESEEDRKAKYRLWEKWEGSATFTVNLQESEFIIDNERKIVIVRVPEPTQSEFEVHQIDLQDKDGDKEAEKCIFVNDGKVLMIIPTDGSDAKGIQMQTEQNEKAKVLIQDSINSRIQDYLDMARKNAQSQIKNLVLELNSNINNLEVTVVVEFISK